MVLCPRHLRSSPTGSLNSCMSREWPLPRLATSAHLRLLRSSPTGSPSLFISREGSFHTFLRRQHLSRLRPSPTDAPRWCIFREEPYHASLHRHTHAVPSHFPTGAPVQCNVEGARATPQFHWHIHISSGRSLPVYSVDVSPGRGPYYASLLPTHPHHPQQLYLPKHPFSATQEGSDASPPPAHPRTPTFLSSVTLPQR